MKMKAHLYHLRSCPEAQIDCPNSHANSSGVKHTSSRSLFKYSLCIDSLK